MSQHTEALKPCPFCGSIEVSRSIGTTGDGKPYPYIECHDCASTAEPEFWNQRAALAEPVAASSVDFLQAYMLANYPDAKGEDLASKVIDALETMDIALGYAAPTPAQPAEQRLVDANKTMQPAEPTVSDMPDVEDMAHSAVQEALSYGVTHDVFHRWMRAVMDKTVAALAAQPAEPANELFQAWLRDEYPKLANKAQPAEPLTADQLKMLNFLYGTGEWDGLWFEQPHPTEKGAFWWRKHLRRVFDMPGGIKEASK